MHLIAAFHKQDIETAIKAYKDAISNGECKKKILNLVVDYYCENCIQVQGAQNLSLIRRFLQHAQMCFNLSNKKTQICIINFQKEFYALMAIVCKYGPHKEENVHEALDISSIEAFVENYGKKRHEELTFLIEEGKVSKDLYKILNIFYYKVRYQEKADVLGMLGWLLGLKSINIGEINYDEVAALKVVKNDIVWYLWKLALSLGKYRFGSCEIVQRFIETHLGLFIFSYQKQKRAND
jgi:hypothetical protein